MKNNTNQKIFQENGISAMSFSQDGRYCAIATKLDHKARIYRIQKLNQINSWVLLQQLKQHSQTISDVDWSKDLKLITSSHDRSTVVWKKTQGQKWQKMLVGAQIKLSILVAKWSSHPRKFALGSSCCVLALGFYSNQTNCWAVRKKQNLTNAPITTLSFHPSSNVVAIGSADFSIKLITTSFKGFKAGILDQIDIKGFNYQGPFERVESCFEELYKIDNLGGWINYISFQDNGKNLLVVPHTNHVKIYQVNQKQNLLNAEEDIIWKQLPFLSGFLNDKRQLFLGGFNKKVAKFAKKNKYEFQNYLNQNQKSNVTSSKGGLVSQFAKGIQKKNSLFGDSPVQSQHLNSIKVISYKGISVSYDINGIIHIWN